ncbi:MAG: DUF362 domain-containing protein [SAR324 cluster bacterium]|nr:DUF362 domain-containing protein [SAR324 cluster bacterium]
MRYPAYLEEKFDFPEFYRLRISYPRPQINELEKAVKDALLPQLERLSLSGGARVCVGVGSRGIRNISKIVTMVCAEIRRAGGQPFIIPAMGSHGGGTPEGQLHLLDEMGVTEEKCGCPVISSFTVRQIGTAFNEVPLYFAEDALAADHVICLNRIKPHTKFKGPVESGVMKMLCIGMGKHQGALSYHTWALKHGFCKLLVEMAQVVAAQSNFRFGLGIVENAYDETMLIQDISADELLLKETELLKIAKINMPRLPVKTADVLIVQESGKEISGSGMDPNITGRAGDLMEDDFSINFKVSRLAVLNLSKASKGNALGIGNADIITTKVYDAMDYEATLMNILTSFSLKKAAIPVIMPSDEKALQAAFTTLGPVPPGQVRALIIKNTLEISECWASQGLVEELTETPLLEILEKRQLEFDATGNLLLDN